MTRTIGHIVAVHELAAERRRAGKPVWDHTLRAVRDENGTFEENRDRFARSLRASSWFRASTDNGTDIFSDLYCLWEDLAEAEDVAEFDAHLANLYDLADYERCFIQFIRV